MIAFRVFRIFSQQGDQKALHLARLPNPLLHFQWYPGRSSIARVEQHILIVRVPGAQRLAMPPCSLLLLRIPPITFVLREAGFGRATWLFE